MERVTPLPELLVVYGGVGHVGGGVHLDDEGVELLPLLLRHEGSVEGDREEHIAHLIDGLLQPLRDRLGA